VTDPTGRPSKPRRRRGGRRARRGNTSSAPSADEKSTEAVPVAPVTRRRRRPAQRTVREFSAGGLVINGLDGPRENMSALLIGRGDRRGRMMWMLPKGHIEVGETPDQTAMREIAEETGIQGQILAELGTINFWFRAQDHIVHKSVQHYLLQFLSGEAYPGDYEVETVEWVPFDEMASRLTHGDERKLAEVAAHLIEVVQSRGRAALPPVRRSQPRRQRQTHSIARNQIRRTQSAAGPALDHNDDIRKNSTVGQDGSELRKGKDSLG
jgi:8-oxo-dGTP pyrophosphatase MutT (NUDIX family)